MKLISLLLIVLFLTSCTQNVGFGLGVVGIGNTSNNVAVTEIIADSETGVHGSVSVSTDIGL